MSGLEELALRCEQATGADRELDCAIRMAVYAPVDATMEQSRINGAWCIYSGTARNGEPRLWESNLGRLLPFTDSIDAAMTLVPEGDDGWGWAIRYYSELSRKSYGEVWERDNADPIEGDYHRSAAATPALALCAAALRARAHLNHSGTGKGEGA